MGIGAHLAIALAAAAALVLSLNMLIEKVALVETTTRSIRTVSVPAQTRAAARSAPAPQIAVAHEAPPPPATGQDDSDRLLLNLDEFDEAVRARIATDDESSSADFRRTLLETNTALHALIGNNAPNSAKLHSKLAATLELHQHDGEVLIATSDSRRNQSAKYNALFEALNARVQQSLEHSWKIFGRVVARESLLRISADLDDLRRHAAAWPEGHHPTPDAAALTSAEQHVAKDLDDNQGSLRRTEGEAWYQAMRADFAALIEARGALRESGDELADQTQRFALQSKDLAQSIHRAMKSRPADPAPAMRSGQAIPTTAAAASAAPAGPPADPGTVSVNTETHTSPVEPPGERQNHLVIGWLSAGLSLILSFILIQTVISILRPVRGLLEATARLARGETDTRVARGGLKELDAVAASFNIMAEELSIARASAQQYQQVLEVKVAERTRKLQQLAESDPLTGLPNRREWFALLVAAIECAKPAGNRVGVLFLDIDNFKYINDSMGHAFGDRVLIDLSRRLQSTVAALGYAARLGGDEFTVIVESVVCVDDVSAAGAAIIQAFQRPLTVDNRELIVNVSVGASIYPDHAQEPEALLKAADVALFRAKSLGRCRLSMFTPDLLEAAEAKFSTEQGLRRAIERGEFELVFQPEVSAETLETALVEALIRWRMPDGTLVAPSRFLGIAEESGLILEIGDWVLRNAIETAANWHHGEWPDVRMAINVSARQFLDAGFVERVQSLLQTHHLPARCIEIELTESVLQTGITTIDSLERLRAHGVTIALDDFGTGYSSLASLQQLPLSRIKLDRSLLEGIDNSPRAAAIAHAIIAMCQGLGLQITAEGIERSEQFNMMLRHPRMLLQGFLLGRPTSRDELIGELANVSQRARQLLLTAPAKTAPDAVDWPGSFTDEMSEAG